MSSRVTISLTTVAPGLTLSNRGPQRTSASLLLLGGCIMTVFARTRLVSVIVFLGVAVSALGEPLGDLLPPQARQTEKRALFGPEFEARYRGYDNNRMGAAFSPDGKLLVCTTQYTGMMVWDEA